MSILIKLELFPDYMDKITSFHFVDKDLLNLLTEFIENKKLFIENFYRICKNIYKHLIYGNISISQIDNEDYDLVNNYLNKFNNNTDLLYLIKPYLDIENTDSYDVSDEDLTDTNNINKIFKFKLDNKYDEINNIFIKNPHLKDDKDLEYILDSD